MGTGLSSRETESSPRAPSAGEIPAEALLYTPDNRDVPDQAAVGVPQWRWDRTLRGQVVIPSIIMVFALAVLGAYLVSMAHDFYERQLTGSLEREARLIAHVVASDMIQEGESIDVGERLAARHGASLSARVTLIRVDGTVFGDSVRDAALLENQSALLEVRAALNGDTGVTTRRTAIAQEDYRYVAVPIHPLNADGAPDRSQPIIGVARIGYPLDAIEANVARLQRDVILATSLAAVLAVLSALVVAKRLAGGLRTLEQRVVSVAGGRLDAQVEPNPIREIGELGLTFNAMTGELRSLVAEIERSRSRLEAVLGALTDGVVITNEQERVVRVNAAASRLLDADPEEASGRPFVMVSRDHELAALLRDALDLDVTRRSSVEVGFGRRIIDASAQPITGPRERLGLVVLRDVTELRRLEAVRREFVANVSHELRTPLASIRALVETLEAGAIDDPVIAQDFFGRIINEVDRLAALVDELLDLARLESGRVVLRLERLDATDLLTRGVERLAPQTERARLTLEMDIPDNLPPVEADRARIEQVLLNLVHNAIKFTPADGSIRVSARLAAPFLRVDVKDTGVGIAEEEVPRLFERFYKADKARRSDGTGLGLAIAKHIVQAHGGDVWAESSPDRGSTFSFTIRLAAEMTPGPPSNRTDGG